MKYYNFVGVLLLSFAAIGCRTTINSQVKHQEGDLSQGQPWLWMDPANVKVNLNSRTIAQSDPLFKRLQRALNLAWDTAVKIDRNISQYRIPKPSAVVVDSNELNAWVDAGYVCIPASRGQALPTEGALLHVKYQKFSLSSEACYQSVRDFEPGEFVTWFNAQGFKCQIRIENDTFLFSQDCNGAFSKSKLIKIPTPFSSVFLTNSILKLLTDDELMYVVSHELAHYLRSHFTGAITGYNYFYKDDDSERNQKPKPAPSFLEKTAELIKLSDMAPDYTIEGSLYHGPTIESVMQFVKANKSGRYCEGSEKCISQCDMANNAASADLEIAILGSSEKNIGFFDKLYPFSPLSTSLVDDLLGYEKKAENCLSNLSSSIFWDLSSYSSILLGHLSEPERNELKVKLQSSKSLAETIRVISKYFKDQRERLKLLLAEVKNHKLGFYTVEQEADDIALEIMWKSGISISHAVNAQMKLLQNSEKQWNYDFQRCNALMKNNWIEEGNETYLGPEALSDPHHSPCYRIWNILHEMKAHKWG